MSGKKYTVEQNGQFLGHWTAHTPTEAVNKMLNSYYPKCYELDNSPFYVSKGDNISYVQL